MIKVKKIIFLFIVLSLVMFISLVSAQETGGENQTANETNYTAEYDPEILDAFENQILVRVIVRLVDNSNITINGTKEERRELLRQKDEWFKPVIDEVLTTLSEDEFESLGKLSDGFGGSITKKGFYKLLNNSYVKKINLDRKVSITQNASKNFSMEKEPEPKIVSDTPISKEINEVKRKNLMWFWVIAGTVMFTILSYLMIKIKRR